MCVTRPAPDAGALVAARAGNARLAAVRHSPAELTINMQATGAFTNIQAQHWSCCDGLQQECATRPAPDVQARDAEQSQPGAR